MPADQFLTRTNGTPLVRIGVRIPAVQDGWHAILTKPFLMKDLYGAVDTALDRANNGGRPNTPTTTTSP
jgi:hypothetical protein